MAETKKETFIFHGLGFPIELIDCPMKKVLDEWVIDVNLNALQLFVFKGLIHKPSPLTGGEMRFMRKFMHLTTEEFGKKLGVTHAAVVRWEKEQVEMSPVCDVYVRMLCMDSLKPGKINSIFKEINPQKLKEAESTELMSVNIADLQEAS
jgi:DNA-binding XRE family transcriptional regulator